MKNYLNFNLDSKKFFTFWILFIVLYLLPYVYLVQQLESMHATYPPLQLVGILPLLVLVALSLYFFFIKLYIEAIGFKEKNFQFDATFGKYMGKLLLNLLFTVLTLGLYSPWFAEKMTRFFANNTSYDTNRFNFLGKGWKLFIIITFSLIIPIVILELLKKFYGIGHNTTAIVFNTIVMIPYMYLVYKWMMNFEFKNYRIYWETDFWSSCGKIALEMFLTIITVGIYFPLAYIRLYKYFVEKTVADSLEKKIRFGYDMEQGKDFLFIWGQTLLLIITLTIYMPWYCNKIGKRFLSKTYSVE